MFKNVKADTERMNALIVRAETLVNDAQAQQRELTEDEAAELAEIRDTVMSIKKKLDAITAIDGAKIDGETAPVEDGTADKATEEAETRAFESYIRGVINERDTEYPMTKANNGAIIPTTIAKKIIEQVYDLCPILEKSEKFNVGGKLEIPVYPEDSTENITVAFASEFSDLTSTTGNFDSVELSGYLAGALTKISRSLVNNAAFDVVGFVIKRMAYEIAAFIEKNLLGNGGGSVTGLGDASNVNTLLSTSTITADDLIVTQGMVKDIYQNNAIWVMTPATRDAIRQLKDDTGRYLLNDDISSPFGKTLLGKPVYVSDNMNEIAAGKKVIYYGDMSGLATKFSEEMSIEVLRELYAAQHAIGVVGWLEFDAKTINNQKIAVVKMAAS